MSGRVFAVPALSRKDIRDLTRRLREILGLGQAYFPIVHVLEFALPRIYTDFAFDIVAQGEMGQDHGQTFPDSYLIRIREDVYERACAGFGRDRMTIAHEVGHLMLHRQLPMTRAVGRDEIPAYRSSEWQANCFGGELLFPASAAPQYPSAAAASDAFGITLEAAETQLRAYKKDGVVK